MTTPTPSDDTPASPTQARLAGIFSSVAQRMRADFEANREQVKHAGLKGRGAEGIVVSRLLEKYLPATVTIRRNAEIVSTAGDVSTEVDVMVCDPETPPLWAEHDVEIVPIECVHGVIEVKSVLDITRLHEAWKNAAAIKRFPKAAYLPGGRLKVSIKRYGKEWFYNPTVAYLFAYTSKISLDTLREHMWNLAQDTDPEHRLDGIWILDQGSFTWRNQDGNGWLIAQPGPVWCMTIPNVEGGSPIPLMVMQLQGVFQYTVSVPRLFNVADYMGNLPFGRPSISGPPDAERPAWLDSAD